MQIRAVAASLLVGVGLFVIACGDDATGGGTGSPSSTGTDKKTPTRAVQASEGANAESFADNFARRTCEEETACCFLSGYGPANIETCQTEVAAKTRSTLAGGVTYDPVFGQACLVAIATQTCTGSDDESYVACGRALRGKGYDSKTLGDGCELSSDCRVVAGADLTGCFGTASGGLTCQAYRTLAVGAACTEPSETATEVSASCDYGTARCDAGFCAARLTVGGKCDSKSMDYDQCDDTSVCVEDVCKSLPYRGGPCADETACGDFYVCRQGLCAEKKQTDLDFAPRHCVLLP